MAKSNKERHLKVVAKDDPTKEKLPDGSRKYKMFKTTDEESAKAVDMSRFLLRYIDKNMLDAMMHEEKDDKGNVLGSEVVMYIRDSEKGDFIFTINTMYVNKEEPREKIDSSNRETPPTNE